MPLNPKQKRFVNAYLLDPNATQAAKAAGYSAKTAYSQGQRLLKHVEAAAAIQAGQARLAKKAEVSLDWLIDEFKENNALAREGNPVIDRYGKPTGGVMRQIGASNKALESIAVLTGHWITKGKVEHDVSGGLLELMKRIDGKTRGL